MSLKTMLFKTRFNLNSFLKLGTNSSNEMVLGENYVIRNGAIRPAYRNENAIYWEAEQEKGCLWLYHYGLAAHGFIENNGKRIEIAKNSEDVKYTLYYTNQKGKKLKYDFFMGTRMNPETKGFLIYGRLEMENKTIIESFPCDEDGNIAEGENDNGFLKTYFDNEKRLCTELDLSSIWLMGDTLAHENIGEDFDIWSISLVFSHSFKPSGTLYEQQTNDGITVKGKCFNIKIIEEESNDFVKKINLSTEKIQNLKTAFEQTDDILSITELYTLEAPDMGNANKLAAQTLYYLAIYSVADEKFNCKGTDIKWQDWFGLNKETAEARITDIHKNLLNLVGANAKKEIKVFLKKYAEACLSNSYTSSTEQTLVDALSSAKNRLQKDYNYCTLPDLCSYYLQGDGKTCMVNDPSYNLLMEEINKYVYIKLTKKLEKYAMDKQGNWGEKLYNQCTKNLQQLRISTLTSSTGSSELSHKSMMLTILDNKDHAISDNNNGTEKIYMTYAEALYAKVFNLQLSELADSMNSEYTGSSGTDFTNMMSKIYGIVWKEIQKDVSDYFSQDILKQFKELQAEYSELTEESFVNCCLEMTEASMSLIEKGATLTTLIPKLSTLSQKPWAAYSANICSIVLYATSIASLSTVFMNWSQTTSLEKAEAILICIQGVTNIAASAVKIANIHILLDPKASFNQKINASLRLKFDGEEMSTIKGLAEANGQEFDVNLEDIAKKLNKSVNSVGNETAQVSKTTKFFKVSAIVVRVLNIVIMGFITVVSAIQIAKEAREGGYTVSVYMEIIATTCLSISLICEAVVFGAELLNVTVAFVPIIGAVAAFIGFIFQIAASALRKPINPLEEFIKQEIVAFLNKLAIPSKEWIDNHNKSSENKVISLSMA